MTQHTWTKGQQVALNRRQIVTIDRVTPSGRAVIGSHQFSPTGRQHASYSGKNTIEPLTPEIAAEIALFVRSQDTRIALSKARDKVSRYIFENWGAFRGRFESSESCDTAERLTAAILAVLGPEA